MRSINKAESDFKKAINLTFDQSGELSKELQGNYKVSLYNCPDIPGHKKFLGPTCGWNFLDIKMPFVKQYKGLYFSYVNWKDFTKFDYDVAQNPEPVRKFYDNVKILTLKPVLLVGEMRTKNEFFIHFYLEKV